MKSFWELWKSTLQWHKESIRKGDSLLRDCPLLGVAGAHEAVKNSVSMGKNLF